MPPTIDAILDDSTLAAIRACSTATCEMLDPGAPFHHPVALLPPRPLTPNQVSELAVMLLDPRSWFFAKKRCLPRETARFRLSDGEVDVIVGMTCADWIVTRRHGRQAGGFFDPVSTRMRTLLKEIFPEYASPEPRSMWRSGVIHRLRAATADSGE